VELQGGGILTITVTGTTVAAEAQAQVAMELMRDITLEETVAQVTFLI
jgi:hypothetical protein